MCAVNYWVPRAWNHQNNSATVLGCHLINVQIWVLQQCHVENHCARNPTPVCLLSWIRAAPMRIQLRKDLLKLCALLNNTLPNKPVIQTFTCNSFLIVRHGGLTNGSKQQQKDPQIYYDTICDPGPSADPIILGALRRMGGWGWMQRMCLCFTPSWISLVESTHLFRGSVCFQLSIYFFLGQETVWYSRYIVTWLILRREGDSTPH